MEKKTTKKPAPLPVVDHIESYADNTGFGEEGGDLLPLQEEEKYDEADRSWMYENADESIEDEDDITDEDLWDDCGEPVKIPDASSHTVKPTVNHDEDTYMKSLIWFNDITKKGKMSDIENRYVALMVVELAKFYFTEEQIKRLSDPEKDALREIYRKIGESGLCSDR